MAKYFDEFNVTSYSFLMTYIFFSDYYVCFQQKFLTQSCFSLEGEICADLAWQINSYLCKQEMLLRHITQIPLMFWVLQQCKMLFLRKKDKSEKLSANMLTTYMIPNFIIMRLQRNKMWIADTAEKEGGINNKRALPQLLQKYIKWHSRAFWMKIYYIFSSDVFQILQKMKLKRPISVFLQRPQGPHQQAFYGN